jgi:alpha-tubulin suppressor-like RCC1 family protein
VKRDGTLWAWGDNTSGQLGIGNTTGQTVPVEVGSGYASVAAGFDFAAAVKTDGTLWVWGGNVLGQLGTGDTVSHATPVQVARLGNGVTAVAAGDRHTLAVKADGTLWAWGSNGSGQLGTGGTSLQPQTTPVQVVQVGNGLASVAAGSFHTVAVKADGTLWTWGTGFAGQLGTGDTVDHPTPVQVGSGFSSAAAGSVHTLAVKADGTLWAWGDNGSGQLGTGDKTQRAVPVQVGSGFTSVSTAEEHTAALKADGSIWTWGNNLEGQLGLGFAGRSMVPVPVP